MSRPSRAGGLPSGPGPRSRSRARGPAETLPPSNPRPMRSQKSMPSIRNEEPSHRRPPMPRGRPDRQHAASPNPSSSGYPTSDDSSNASSASSFMDRLRTGTGYTSSRTSIDDDGTDEPPKAQATAASSASNGDGTTIWSTVVGAAGSLSLNVSKAWASNVPLLAGEETPPGSESRLTRAMKAYHREKATSPADLPAFLFDEHERRVNEPARETRGRRDAPELEDRDEMRPRGAPSKGLKNVYATATSSAPPERRSAETTRRPFGDIHSTPMKATDRLRAMRDAKKGSSNSGQDIGRDRSTDDARPTPPPAAPPRVGLPQGPRRR